MAHSLQLISVAPHCLGPGGIVSCLPEDLAQFFHREFSGAICLMEDCEIWCSEINPSLVFEMMELVSLKVSFALCQIKYKLFP
jgi:hypothetical protein